MERRHQITVADLSMNCDFTIASSAGRNENKRIKVMINPIKKFMMFKVMNICKNKSELHDTIESAVKAYNNI